MKYKTFKVDLTPTEYGLINTYCSLKNMTKATFLRLCMKEKGLINFDDSLDSTFKETDLFKNVIKSFLYKDFNIIVCKDFDYYCSYINNVSFGHYMFCFGCQCESLEKYIVLLKNNIDTYIDLYNDEVNY